MTIEKVVATKILTAEGCYPFAKAIIGADVQCNPKKLYRVSIVEISEGVAPAVDASKAFAKGFNTLETVDGKYTIVMQFAGHDDAWAAYIALGELTK